MPPKQKTKADLKQAIDQLTEKLRAAEARLDADVEAERDEALERADEAERRVLDLEQEIGQLKKDLEGTTDHVASEVEREVKTRLKRAESDLAGSEEHVRQLEFELDDARDEVDRLEWKLESAERDAELQAARVREQAQRDHRKELEARDELIALLKEKLSRRQNEPKAMDTEAPPPSSSTGSGCTPDPQHTKEPRYQVAGRVMVFMPHEKADKLSLPYHGPYRIIEVLTNGLSVRPVDKPNTKPILVNVDRVTPCPPELADESWLGPKKERKRARTRYNLRK